MSAEMVKEILFKRCPNFYYGQNIITPGEKKTEHEAVVSEIHRVSGTQDVIWVTDLCEQLPYVPSDKIAWSLSVSDDFVWINEGKYFVMEYLIINDEEISAIQDYVSCECSKKGYASITDLPFGSIPEQNYELSITALYSAVYIAVLKQQYQLNGKILTRDESGIDIVALLKNYCQANTSCTVAEVMNKAIELVGLQNRQNSFVALYDTMIRVDKEHFVSDAQIHFDVDQIDCVLQGIIGNRFASIKSITTFALFPPCGHSWNHYLLESFCYRFSKKYQLRVLNYNDKNAGIIAAKSTNISYTDMLCEAAAKADVPLTPEAVGQYFFENGLTAKRKFSSLPEIIEKYLMEYSCLKTLAGKHQSTSRKMMRKYRDGKGGWGVPYQTKAGIKRRSFARFMDCKNTDLWTDKIIDFAIAHVGSRTSFDDRLSACVCELCGKTNVPLEIHHVNKVKNLKGKQLWELAMIAKKRKTLAVCKDCHHKIHHP